MKKQTAGKLVRNLVAGLPGFKASGRLLYLPVNNGMLTGCYFESSDFEQQIILVNYFATIIAYPLEFLVFDLTFRLRDGRGGERWSLFDEMVASEISDAIKLQALPLIKKLQSPETFAEEICRVDTIQGQRAAAVAFAKAGEKERALGTIVKLSPKLNLGIAWQGEIAGRLTELLKKLEANNDASLLAGWEEMSRAKLNVA